MVPAVPFVGTDRFVLRRRLGSGGFGTVHEAFDRERRAIVALKVLQRHAPDDLARFKAEFRALADLSHPNIVTLYELCTASGYWFFTMEYLSGVDLYSYLCGENDPGKNLEFTANLTRSGDTSRDLLLENIAARNYPSAVANAQALRDVKTIRAVFLQLGKGLIALHGAGKLHRDLKPSNIIVTENSRVVIVDLGLTVEIAQQGERGEGAMGTPAYMSPEQARGEPVGPASDWYAVGVMLYRVLSGKLPFEGTAAEMLAQKQYRQPSLPPDIAETDLGALCLELLRVEPSQRPLGTQALRVLSRETPFPVEIAPADMPEEAAPLGRKQQLDELLEAFQEVRDGRPVLALCHGSSGMGKTTLCRQLLRCIETEVDRALVLSGRCYEYEAVPFKALDGVMDALAAHLLRLPADEVAALLPAEVGALCRVFSTLSRVRFEKGRDAPAGLSARDIKLEAFTALRELLARLGRRRRVAIFIDDLQWGDLDSVELLLSLLRPAQGPGIFLLISYRTEERETSPVLQALFDALHGAIYSGLRIVEIKLEPLSANDAEAFAAALLGAPHQAQAKALAAESQGHPFLLAELCRNARSLDGAFQFQTSTLAAAIQRRLRPLSGPARRLLDTVVVAGQPLARDAAERAASGVWGAGRRGRPEAPNAQPGDEGAGDLLALSSARISRLIRVQWSQGREELLPYHDAIRELVMSTLSPEVLADCHGRLARALESSDDVEPERLALHFGGAGDFERAARYTLEGATRASEVLAFERAARLYRQARELGTLTPVETQRILVLEADAYVAAGRPKEAALAYTAAAEGQTLEEARVLKGRAVDQWIQGHYVREGLAAFSELLTERGERIPKTKITLWFALVGLYLRVRWYRRIFQARPTDSIDKDKLALISLYSAAGFGLRDLDTIWCVYFLMRALLLALEVGYFRFFVIATLWDLIQNRMNDRRPYERELDAAQALAAQSMDQHVIAIGHAVGGAIALCRTEFFSAENRLGAARRFLKANGTVHWWIRDQAESAWLGLLPLLGKMKVLALDGAAAYEDIVRRGVPYLGAMTLLNGMPWMALAADDIAQAETIVRVAVEPWVGTTMRSVVELYAAGARVIIALYKGDAEQARMQDELRRAPQNRRLATSTLLGRVFNPYYHAQVALALAAREPVNRAFVRVARKRADELSRLDVPIAPPLASAVFAAISVWHGDTEGAIARFRLAENGFREHGMMLHAAAALHYQGILTGGAEGAQLVARADAWMVSEGIRAPDRMAAAALPLGRSMEG